MKNLSLALVTVCLAFSGCKKLEGTFKVNQLVELILKNGKVLSVEAGSYQSEVEIKNNKKQISLKFKTNKNQTILFDVPNSNIPESDGKIFVAAAQNGQIYDLSGVISTTVFDSKQYEGTESCRLGERRVWRCYRNGGDRDSRGQTCYWDYETIYGRRHVEYHYEVTKLTGTYDLLEVNTDISAASFSGSHETKNRKIDHYGSCR